VGTQLRLRAATVLRDEPLVVARGAKTGCSDWSPAWTLGGLARRRRDRQGGGGGGRAAFMLGLGLVGLAAAAEDQETEGSISVPPSAPVPPAPVPQVRAKRVAVIGKQRRCAQQVSFADRSGRIAHTCTGAGASGLVCAKCLLDEGFEVTVFEQEARLGGLWRYDDSTDGTLDAPSHHHHASHCHSLLA
jgi:hypothetical protein